MKKRYMASVLAFILAVSYIPTFNLFGGMVTNVVTQYTISNLDASAFMTWNKSTGSITTTGTFKALQDIKITVDWAVPNDAKQGDYFTVNIPGTLINLNGISTSIERDIRSENNELIGKLTIEDDSSGKVMKVTFTTDFVEKNDNVQGQIWYLFRANDFANDGNVPVNFEINGNLTASGNVNVSKQTPGTGVKNIPNFAKWSARAHPARKIGDYYYYSWTLVVNFSYGSIDNFRLDDLIPAGSPHKILTSEVAAGLGITISSDRVVHTSPTEKDTEMGLIMLWEYTAGDYSSFYERYDNINDWYGARKYWRIYDITDGTMIPDISGTKVNTNPGPDMVLTNFSLTDKSFGFNLDKVTRPVMVNFYTIATVPFSDEAMSDLNTSKQLRNTFTATGSNKIDSYIHEIWQDGGGYATGTQYEFTIYKVNESGANLAGARFDLYKDEACAGQVYRFAVSGTNGAMRFQNIVSGTYYLKEAETPLGYVLNNKIYKLELNDSNDYTLYDADGNIIGNNKIINVKSDGKLTITKECPGSADDFVFLLTNESGAVNLNSVTQTGNSYAIIGNGNAGTFSLGDGSSLTLSGLPAGNYTVKEITTGYSTLYTVNSGTAQTGVSANVTIASGSESTVNFINEVPTGGLTVSKTVLDPDDAPDIADTTDFIFTLINAETMNPVNLDNPSLTLLGAGRISDAASGKFALKHGEDFTVSGLPVGDYKVTEAETIGYKITHLINGVENTSPGSTTTATITVTANTTGAVSFINRELPVITPETGHLDIVKRVDKINQQDASKKFDFEIMFTLDDDSFLNTVEKNGTEVTLDNGRYEFSLANGEVAHFTHIPVGTSYIVTEKDYTNENYLTGANPLTGIVIDDNHENVVFTNTYNGLGNLRLTKKVTGGGNISNFDFLVYFSNDNGILMDGQPFKNGDHVWMSHNKTINFTNIQPGTGYRIIEGNYRDDGFESSSAGYSDQGTINNTTEVEVVFENMYNPSPDVVEPLAPLETFLEIIGQKNLTGRDMLHGEFTFLLTDENGRVVATADSDDAGLFRFTIRYDDTDVGYHRYTITEIQGDDTYITYDPSVYEVEVNVYVDEEYGISSVIETLEIIDEDADIEEDEIPVVEDEDETSAAENEDDAPAAENENDAVQDNNDNMDTDSDVFSVDDQDIPLSNIIYKLVAEILNYPTGGIVFNNTFTPPVSVDPIIEDPQPNPPPPTPYTPDSSLPDSPLNPPSNPVTNPPADAVTPPADLETELVETPSDTLEVPEISEIPEIPEIPDVVEEDDFIVMPAESAAEPITTESDEAVILELDTDGTPLGVMRWDGEKYTQSTLEYWSEFDCWLEFDEEGIPLGVWRYDEDADEWIFDEDIPLGFMPVTGMGNRDMVMIGMALGGMLMMISGVMLRRKRCRV